MTKKLHVGFQGELLLLLPLLAVQQLQHPADWEYTGTIEAMVCQDITKDLFCKEEIQTNEKNESGFVYNQLKKFVDKRNIILVYRWIAYVVLRNRNKP